MTSDIRIRVEVLKTALMLEELASAFLAGLLGVKNKKESLSFSNKGSALSFNQKIHLLIDIGALDKDTKSKFQTFMEIRNQFMHNLKAASFESCFSFTEKKDNYILSKYPQNKKLSKEIQLEKAFNELSSELVKLTYNLIKKINEQTEAEVRREFDKQTIDDLTVSINYAKIMLDKYIEVEIEKGTVFTAKKLKGMGTFVSQLIYNKAIKRVKERHP